MQQQIAEQYAEQNKSFSNSHIAEILLFELLFKYMNSTFIATVKRVFEVSKKKKI
jgi:hypothetical protein